MGLSRRDQCFFCVAGTLLAMGVVVYQGDYEGYHRAALASVPWSNANLDQGNLLITSTKYTADNMAFAPAGTQRGHRTTPGSGDPYAYIRTGAYPKILAREAEVSRSWAAGDSPAPLHALNLNPAPSQGQKAKKEQPNQMKAQAHLAAKNVQSIAWAHGETELSGTPGCC
jgi:hypothetical protein